MPDVANSAVQTASVKQPWWKRAWLDFIFVTCFVAPTLLLIMFYVLVALGQLPDSPLLKQSPIVVACYFYGFWTALVCFMVLMLSLAKTKAARTIESILGPVVYFIINSAVFALLWYLSKH